MDKVMNELDMLNNKMHIMNMSVEKQMDAQKSRFEEMKTNKLKSSGGSIL